MKIEIELTKKQSKRLTEFWAKHGSFGSSMLARPCFQHSISRDNRRSDFYILKIGMFSPAEAELIATVLMNINLGRNPKGKKCRT